MTWWYPSNTAPSEIESLRLHRLKNEDDDHDESNLELFEHQPETPVVQTNKLFMRNDVENIDSFRFELAPAVITDTEWSTQVDTEKNVFHFKAKSWDVANIDDNWDTGEYHFGKSGLWIKWEDFSYLNWNDNGWEKVMTYQFDTPVVFNSFHILEQYIMGQQDARRNNIAVRNLQYAPSVGDTIQPIWMRSSGTYGYDNNTWYSWWEIGAAEALDDLENVAQITSENIATFTTDFMSLKSHIYNYVEHPMGVEYAKNYLHYIAGENQGLNPIFYKHQTSGNDYNRMDLESISCLQTYYIQDLLTRIDTLESTVNGFMTNLWESISGYIQPGVTPAVPSGLGPTSSIYEIMNAIETEYGPLGGNPAQFNNFQRLLIALAYVQILAYPTLP